MGANEVFIKSVALALPVYAMSVFQLPKDLCARITSDIVEFWWSSGDKREKFHELLGKNYANLRKMEVWGSMTLED